jgi:hypothetical protein
MNIDNIDFEKYSNESIDFILSQASKQLDETLKAYRETTGRGFGGLGIYVVMLSYTSYKSFEIGLKVQSISYFILLTGAFLCISILWKSLTPAEINLPGALPQALMQDHFQLIEGESQIREYKEQTIIGYNDAILKNNDIISKRACNFKNSAICLFIAIFFSLLCNVIISAICL